MASGHGGGGDKWHVKEKSGTWIPDGYISPIESGAFSLRDEFDEGRYCKVFLAGWAPPAPVRHTPGAGGPMRQKGPPIDVAIKMVDGPRHAAEEAWALQRLAHTNVVPIIDYFMHHGHDCIVMPLCTAGTLADHAVKGITPPAAADVVRQLSSALAYIHASGYVHGDVKMENVLCEVVAPKGECGTIARSNVRLCDFGSAARLVPEHGGSDRRPLGTVAYSPPECFDALRTGAAWAYDEKCDTWALGCLLWEVVTGDCLPLGDGPDVIGRVAKAGGAPWDALKRKLLPAFDEKLAVEEEPGVDAGGKAEREAAAAMLRLLQQCWIPEPASSRPNAADVAREFSAWEPHLACEFAAVKRAPKA